MTRDLQASSQGAPPGQGRPCPGGRADHIMLELPEDELRQAGLPAGQPVHVDLSREPATGDLVWVELVRYGSTQRLVRRFALDGGWVTLSVPGGGAAAIMRRRAELHVLGVVDGACPAMSP
jgi:hypothetical protein